MYKQRWCRLGSAASAVAVLAFGCVPAATAFAAPASAASFRTVDVPGAVGTTVTAVNDSGTLAGDWSDSSGNVHGFIERPGGQPIAFDAPGGTTLTVPFGINDEGSTVGVLCCDPGFDSFLRSPDGAFTMLPYDPSTNGATYFVGINDSGVLVGSYQNAAGDNHGFIYNHGTFTTIDYPGAGTGSGQGTQLGAINNSGVILGVYVDPSGVAHGFTYQKGTFKPFDAPGAGTDPALCDAYPLFTTEGTNPFGISASGVTVGSVCNDEGAFGWVLSNGQFASLNEPNAATGATYPFGISENGRFVAGSYYDNTAANLQHGFVATLTP